MLNSPNVIIAPDQKEIEKLIGNEIKGSVLCDIFFFWSGNPSTNSTEIVF